MNNCKPDVQKPNKLQKSLAGYCIDWQVMYGIICQNMLSTDSTWNWLADRGAGGPFTPEELPAVLKNQKPGKSLGLDSILPDFILYTGPAL